MRPLVLTLLPNSLNFIGTFDLVNYRDWWTSAPIPGNVAEIKQVIWVYGSIYLALCLMEDGTYSVFQSINYGYSWALVWNHSGTIWGLTKIDLGWVIASASDGWWESYDSGTNFAFVSGALPDAKAVCCLGLKTLLAHDGRYIWKSVDYARTWRKVFDCYQLGNANNIVPSIDGLELRAYAACGPHVIYSDDKGETWNIFLSWSHGYFLAGQYYPSGGSRTIAAELNKQKVIQVLVLGCTGPSKKDIMFVVLSQRPAEGINRLFCASHGTEGDPLTFTPKFDQYISDGLKLSANEVLQVGTSSLLRIAFSGQSNWSTTVGGLVPDLKYSVDGGWTWVELNPASFRVYNGDPQDDQYFLGQSTVNGFTVETQVSSIWAGPRCHNWGYYETVTQELPAHWTRSLSYDMDFFIRGSKNKTYTAGFDLKKEKTKTYQMSAIFRGPKDKTYTAGMLLQKIKDFNYRANLYVLKAQGKTYGAGLVLMQRRDKTYQMGLKFKCTWELKYQAIIAMQKTVQKTYGANMILVKSYHDEIMRDLELRTPQFFNIIAPTICRKRLLTG
jgi:hypothetical protein